MLLYQVHFDSVEDPDGSVPVRKGTMSKDLPQGAVNYTMAGVMAKAHQLGFILVLTPPIVIVAYVTGDSFIYLV